MTKTTADEFVSTPEGMRLFQQERAIESVTGLICELMEERGVSRSQLAVLLGKTPGWVTQLLDGEKNKTIKTLSDVFCALGHSLNFIAGSLDIREVIPGVNTISEKSVMELSWDDSVNLQGHHTYVCLIQDILHSAVYAGRSPIVRDLIPSPQLDSERTDAWGETTLRLEDTCIPSY